MEIKDIIEISILFILFIAFIVWLILMIHSIKLSHRINGHTIINDSDCDLSVPDRLLTWYKNKKDEISEEILVLSKACGIDKRKKEKELSNIIDSIVCSISFFILYIVLCIFHLQKVSVLASFLAFILGFILPGIYNLTIDQIKRKNIEKNLLKVITIINHNLQANMSIKEALVNTKEKVDGDLKIELENVINDLNHGLSLEVAFKRMKDRCGVEDIAYLTTTLSILGKTGGNTKEVFDYLENLFKTRKRLSQELDATIASSKLVYIILSILPIIVFVGMFLIYDNYLMMFITTPLGNLLGIGELVLYFVYIIVVKKIMIIEKY